MNRDHKNENREDKKEDKKRVAPLQERNPNPGGAPSPASALFPPGIPAAPTAGAPLREQNPDPAGIPSDQSMVGMPRRAPTAAAPAAGAPLREQNPDPAGIPSDQSMVGMPRRAPTAAPAAGLASETAAHLSSTIEHKEESKMPLQAKPLERKIGMEAKAQMLDPFPLLKGMLEARIIVETALINPKNRAEKNKSIALLKILLAAAQNPLQLPYDKYIFNLATTINDAKSEIKDQSASMGLFLNQLSQVYQTELTHRRADNPLGAISTQEMIKQIDTELINSMQSVEQLFSNANPAIGRELRSILGKTHMSCEHAISLFSAIRSEAKNQRVMTDKLDQLLSKLTEQAKQAATPAPEASSPPRPS